MTNQSATATLDEKTEKFKRLFMIVVSVVIGASSAMMGLLSLATGAVTVMVVATTIIVALCIVTITLSIRGRHRVASYIFVSTFYFGICLNMIVNRETQAYVVSTQVTLLVIAAFLMRPSYALILGGIGVISQMIAYGTLWSSIEASPETYTMWGASVFHVIVMSFLVLLFAREAESNLSFLRRRLIHNDSLFDEVPEAASKLSSATHEIYAMMQQLTQGTVNQSSAIDETQQVLRSLSSASGTIVKSTSSVQAHAQTTLKNSQLVVDHISTLSRHSQEIVEVLQFIKQVAQKSDLLALNAALEGTKAGERGKGFSLVATQMQRLAEDVARSASQIGTLTKDIIEATTTTQLSMEEATKLAQSTTDSAQQISLVTQQQRSGVDQVSIAIDEISEIATQTAAGAKQTIVSADELRNLAEHLTEVVERYRTIDVDIA